MNIQFIIGPLVGLIIGYITNSIAIKMLFRPLRPIYIGKFKVPFTPGLIPKEKTRIARSIGGVIGSELLNNDTLNQTLLSEKILRSISGLVDKVFNRMKKSDLTIREDLYEKTDKELVDNIVESANNDITKLIHKKLTKFNFGTEISKKVIINLRDQYIDKGKLTGMFAKMIDDSMIDSFAEPIGKSIDKYVSENSEDIVGDLIGNEVSKVMDAKTSDFAIKYEYTVPKIKETVLSIYSRTVKNDLPRIMDTLNVAEIVENKINEYDIKEFEALLFSIMKKELNAIIWLGAALGFIMGFLNAFIAIIIN